MSTSPARLAANRQNALRSTGPRSPEGKAASRRNAFKHGLAGAGDLAAAADDLALVAERAAAFEQELGATGALEQTLAHRVALLSVRLERAAVVRFRPAMRHRSARRWRRLLGPGRCRRRRRALRPKPSTRRSSVSPD